MSVLDDLATTHLAPRKSVERPRATPAALSTPERCYTSTCWRHAEPGKRLCWVCKLLGNPEPVFETITATDNGGTSA